MLRRLDRNDCCGKLRAKLWWLNLETAAKPLSRRERGRGEGTRRLWVRRLRRRADGGFWTLGRPRGALDQPAVCDELDAVLERIRSELRLPFEW